PVFDRLQARIRVEQDAVVRGVLAESLGRLPYRTAAEVDAAQAALLSLLAPPEDSRAAASATPASAPAIITALGVAHGFESLARTTKSIQPLGATATQRLVDLAHTGIDRSGTEVMSGLARDQLRRVRRLAMAALTAAAPPSEAAIRAAVADPDAQVRRL